MYRFLFAPRWVGFHLLVVVGIIVMVNLGFWQLRRLDDRQAFNDVVAARYDATPVPLDDLLVAGVALADIEWRPVTASGTFLPDEQILIVNRSQNNRAGDNVVTPLLLDDGRILLVNRGFVPLGIPVPIAPTGRVELVGRLHPSQERRLGQLSDPAEGDLEVAQRIDIQRLAAQLPGEVVPMYIDAFTPDPRSAGTLPEPVIAPDLSEGNHLSYAFQWFIFAVAVAAGWAIAVHRAGRERRRQRDRPSEAEESPPE